MSTPFKMKGWSGSPIRQNPKPNLQASLANIQKSISNTLKGVGTNIRKHVKPQSSSSGLGLTSLEKAQAKKHGMSQYQWKTDKNKSGTRANRYARDNKLGKYAKKTTSEVLKYPDEKDRLVDREKQINWRNWDAINMQSSEVTHQSMPSDVRAKGGSTTKVNVRAKYDLESAIPGGGPEQPVTEGVQYHHLGKVYNSLSEAETAQEKAGGKDAITPTIDGEKATQDGMELYQLQADTPTEVDYGTGMTTKDWKQESSTGWSLHELTQERKKFDVGSPEYDKIQKVINEAYRN